MWQACTGVVDIILFSASNENSQQHTRTAECPPFSQWYPMVLASIGWPACDLYAGPERVQPQAPVKVGPGLWWKVCIIVLPGRGPICVTVASSASWRVYLPWWGECLGIFAVALLILKGEIHLCNLHWEVRMQGQPHCVAIVAWRDAVFSTVPPNVCAKFTRGG